MINKKASCQEQTFHTPGVLQYLQHLSYLVSFEEFDVTARGAFGIYERLVKTRFKRLEPRGSSPIALYCVWATCWCWKRRLNFHQSSWLIPSISDKIDVCVASGLQQLKSFTQTQCVCFFLPPQFDPLLLQLLGIPRHHSGGGDKRHRGPSSHVQ